MPIVSLSKLNSPVTIFVLMLPPDIYILCSWQDRLGTQGTDIAPVGYINSAKVFYTPS